MSHDDQRREYQRLEQQRESARLEQQRQSQRDELSRQESRRALESDFQKKEMSNRCVNNDGPIAMPGGLCLACYNKMSAAEAKDDTPNAGTDWQAFLLTLPEQIHHFAPNKSKTGRNELFEEVTRRYGLELDGEWNKERMRHSGGHADAYTAYVLGTMQFIDDEAKGDRKKFLDLFDELVKQTVRESPQMLRSKAWWE